MSTPRVSIIVLNYDGKQYLEDCLKSVLRQTGPPVEIILVDNGSSDGSVEYVRSAFPDVRIIRNQKNLGFAGGNNRGVGEAKGEFVVLLNNDTTVEQSWLEELIAPLERGEVALVSSRVFTEGIDPRYYEKGGTLSLLGYNIMRVFDNHETLFYPTGCAMGFRRALILKPFDDDYFIYSEDVYLGLRIRFLGLPLKQVPTSIVHHTGFAATNQFPRRLTTFYQERNRLLNMLIFFDRTLIIKLVPLIAANFFARFVFVASQSVSFRRRRGASLRGLVQAYLWPVLHARRIRDKRTVIQKEKKVGDEEVLSLMSCRVLNGETLPVKFINALAYAYCRLVGIHTIEFSKSGQR